MMVYLLGLATAVALWLLLGGSGGRRLRVKRIEEEFEARLRPVNQDGPTWMADGKAERELHQDGTVEFELWCSGFRTNTGSPRLPAGAQLEVVLDDRVIARVPLSRDRIKLHLSSATGDEVPEVGEGTPVAIRYEGVELMTGTFERD